MSNIIDLKTHHWVFKTPGIRLSVSSRKVLPEMNIINYLKIFYMYTDIGQIESVFGNTVFYSKLYGGRSFKIKHSLTSRHIKDLEAHGIHLSLTLTNHFFDDASYKESQELLKTHHKKGNSVICVNDELAMRVKNDFPDYMVKASIIKDSNTIDKIEQCLNIYDHVVLPMEKNEDDLFLQRIADKSRIILFGNATCAFTCPSRTCYQGFSQGTAGKPVTSGCSKGKIPRLDTGDVFFNLKKFKEMGFSQFKLVPAAPAAAAGIALFTSERRRLQKELINHADY